jgi:hypothetical protein
MKIYKFLSIRWILIFILSFFLYNSNKENLRYEKENVSSNDKIKDLNLIVENLNLNLNNINEDLNNEEIISTKYNNYYIDNLKKKKVSGAFNTYFSNGKINTSGYLVNGEERGNWIKYNYDGKIIRKYHYSYECIGALCYDGSKSSSTGRGTCSWHGGVNEWLYDYVRIDTYP